MNRSTLSFALLLASAVAAQQPHKVTQVEVDRITRSAILIDTHNDVTSKTGHRLSAPFLCVAINYFDFTATTSISTSAHGATNAATFIAARAGLLGCSLVPKNCV